MTIEPTTTTDDAKPGAPRGNRNRLRTGRRSQRSLVLGAAHPKHAYAVAAARGLMREAEDAIRAVRDNVTLYEQSLLLELGEWEVSRRLAWRLLRIEAAKLTPDEQAELRRDSAKAANQRARIIKALGLSDPAKAPSPWAVPAVTQGPARPPAGQPDVQEQAQ